MSQWDHLIEARIQEWLAKSPEERMRAPESPLLAELPLELQLMREVTLFDRAARDATDAASAEVLREGAGRYAAPSRLMSDDSRMNRSASPFTTRSIARPSRSQLVA